MLTGFLTISDFKTLSKLVRKIGSVSKASKTKSGSLWAPFSVLRITLYVGWIAGISRIEKSYAVPNHNQVQWIGSDYLIAISLRHWTTHHRFQLFYYPTIFPLSYSSSFSFLPFFFSFLCMVTFLYFRAFFTLAGEVFLPELLMKFDVLDGMLGPIKSPE